MIFGFNQDTAQHCTGGTDIRESYRERRRERERERGRDGGESERERNREGGGRKIEGDGKEREREIDRAVNGQTHKDHTQIPSPPPHTHTYGTRGIGQDSQGSPWASFKKNTDGQQNLAPRFTEKRDSERKRDRERE